MGFGEIVNIMLCVATGGRGTIKYYGLKNQDKINVLQSDFTTENRDFFTDIDNTVYDVHVHACMYFLFCSKDT